MPSYRDLEDGSVEAAEYRVWVRALDHVRPVDGVDYDQVATEHLPAASVHVGSPRGPRGAGLRSGAGPKADPGVLHAPDCEEAPQDAPLLSVEQALNVALTCSPPSSSSAPVRRSSQLPVTGASGARWSQRLGGQRRPPPMRRSSARAVSGPNSQAS
jgi:hypothetical protein